MKIRELMCSVVHSCGPQDSLAAAARPMWEHDCGMLPVVHADGRVVAAITDRDICMAGWTRGRALSELRVADAMSRDVVTCSPDEDVAAAAAKMAQRQVHRLPVVDAAGKLLGILSLNDLAIASANDPRLAKDALTALRGACRPRATVPARGAPPATKDAAETAAGA
ncbi:MAG: CBS domain-containing protein [Planctomycetes bacterium]|nr:CBS domain-containing protein [Planctomycetota bacterium]